MQSTPRFRFLSVAFTLSTLLLFSTFQIAEAQKKSSGSKTKQANPAPATTTNQKIVEQAKNQSPPKTADLAAVTAATTTSTDTSKPATPIEFLSPFESELLQEINVARTEPQKYLAYMQDYRKLYNANRLQILGRKAILTFEGLKAVDEAIDFLGKATPLKAYDPSKGMSFAAKDRLTDMVKTGVEGHVGSDGSLPDDRLNRYGKWSKSIGESIGYNILTARYIVLGMIVDDGTASRGHRNNIYSSDYQLLGLATGESMKPGANCVLVFAGGFKDKEAETASGSAGQAAASTKAATPKK